ncbi:hypothetical protein ZIOFF_055967 [Zingiber officinale]|uniref:Uncharacterized protein n=1 Tax=Zingiber officinale TaxID=94328 RepID=A0A8J5FHD0_ZINOF|nr:hypothetical protein ZIOFF_055967 [Zingiber officinale]
MSAPMITGCQRFIASPHAFSQDGKKLLVCTGCIISIFSASTRMQILELEGGHNDRVTFVIVVSVASHLTEFIKKMKIQFPVHSMITELEGGHIDRVTSVIIVLVASPSSKFMSYYWTSSLYGTICYSDFTSAELIKKVKIQFPVHSMVSRNFVSGSVFLLVFLLP